MPKDTRIHTLRLDYETPDFVVFLESSEFEPAKRGERFPLVGDNGYIRIFCDEKKDLIDSRILKKHLILLKHELKGYNVVINRINEALGKGMYDENCDRYLFNDFGGIVDSHRDKCIKGEEIQSKN